MLGEFTPDDLLHIFIAYLLGMVVAVLVGNGVLLAMGIQSGTDAYLVYSPLVAGILEPLLTKLAPAVVVIRLIRTHREGLLQSVQEHPFLVGAYGGGCVGVVEAFGKVVMQTGMFAGVDSISIGLVLAALGHVLFGGLIGNAIYREQKRQLWHNALTATALTILIHFSWNAYGVLELFS